uniref:Putative tail tubular protein n=1 Tax=viral metagenome TaxID=1070528 RepID=A0A6M3KCD9_9ZZZZ
MTNKIMITWSLFCLAVIAQVRTDRNNILTWLDIQDGDVLAWSEHITGQDVNDMNQWDDFKSVARIPGRSLKACGDIRLDDEVWVVVDRTIDSNDYTFIEQFQPLDWGDDPNYCWFVDCGIGDVNSYGVAEIPEIPEVPEVPPAPFRDEAYIISDADNLYWFDPDWSYLGYTDSPGTVVTTTIAQTADGSKTIVGAGYYVVVYDINLTPDQTFYVPDAGSFPQVISCVRLNHDESVLYVDTAWKLYAFNTSNGDEIWNKDMVWASVFCLDDEDNIYMYRGTGSYTVSKYDSDGNLLVNLNNVGHGRSIVYDSVNNVVIIVGLAPWGKNVRVLNPTNLATLYSYTDTGNALGVIVHDGYYYVCKGTGSDGYNVIKFDSELNVIAHATGGTSAIMVDWDGNIAVSNISELGSTVYRYDTDLNLIDTTNFAGGTFLYREEIAKISYLDDGTPAVPAIPPIPGIEPNMIAADHLANTEVCVYADGRPIGNYTVTEDVNGVNVIDFGEKYDVIIAGINYYSIYESFPLILGSGSSLTSGFQSRIQNVKIDFYESMGCNIGVSIDNSVDWKFSYDNFATAIAPIEEIKSAPFVWGTTREPIIYLWLWKPIPMTIRSINPKMLITIE